MPRQPNGPEPASAPVAEMRIIGSPTIDSSELKLVAEQLWPGLNSSDLRVVAGAGCTDPDWEPLERHRLAIWRRRALMLLPTSRHAAGRALASYAYLRPARRRLIRRAWASLVAVGAPWFQTMITLEARRNSPATTTQTVTQAIGQSSEHPVGGVAMSVRRTANRKALLQVVDRDGATRGFAKVAWNSVSADGVRAETAALTRLDGGSDHLRTPRVISSAEVNGFPYLLVEPLPQRIRVISIDSEHLPSPEELSTIAPVIRHAPPGQTRHVLRMSVRLSQIESTLKSFEGRVALLDLLQRITHVSRPMAVVGQWHGDFAYWNLGRTPDGTLWCWDFENGEPDALAGLDALHWYASRIRTRAGAAGLAHRDALLAASAPALKVIGVPDDDYPILHGTYVAEIIVRSLEMAAADGWRATWATPANLVTLIESASLPAR